MKKFSCVALNLALALTLTTAFCAEGYAGDRGRVGGGRGGAPAPSQVQRQAANPQAAAGTEDFGLGMDSSFSAGAGAGAGVESAAHAAPLAPKPYMVDLPGVTSYLKEASKRKGKERLGCRDLSPEGFVYLIREGLDFGNGESFDEVVGGLFSCIIEMSRGEGGLQRAAAFVNTRIGSRTLVEAAIERVEYASSLDEFISKTDGRYYSAELREKIFNDVVDRALALEYKYRGVSLQNHYQIKTFLRSFVGRYPKYGERTFNDGWGIPLKSILLEPDDRTLRMIYGIRNTDVSYYSLMDVSKRYDDGDLIVNTIDGINQFKEGEIRRLGAGDATFKGSKEQIAQAQLLKNWVNSVLKVKAILNHRRNLEPILGNPEYVKFLLFQIADLFSEAVSGKHDAAVKELNAKILHNSVPATMGGRGSKVLSLNPKDYITGVLKDALPGIPQLRDVAMTKPVNLGELEGVLFGTSELKNQRMAYVLAQPHEDGLVKALCPAEGFKLNGADITKEVAQGLTVAGFYTNLLSTVPSNDAFVTELYSRPYIMTNGQNSAKVAFLSLLERAGGAVRFDTLQHLIAQDGTAHEAPVDADTPVTAVDPFTVTELDAIELMADSLGFAARHEKVWGGARKADLEQTALEALSGKATAQGFTVNLNRKANQEEFVRIVNILDKTIRNMGPAASVKNLKAHVLGDASGDAPDQKLTSHQRNLLAVAVYKLGQINGWDNARVLQEIAGALSIEESDDDIDMSVGGSASASIPHAQEEALGILRQVGKTFKYAPLNTFAAGADEGAK